MAGLIGLDSCCMTLMVSSGGEKEKRERERGREKRKEREGGKDWREREIAIV